MKVISLFSCIAALSFPLVSFSADVTILCDVPQGTRIDYFSVNSANLQNETFLMGRDKISGMRPKIVLHERSHEVDFIISDAAHVESAPMTGSMKVLAYNEEQISFTGIVKSAPVLATYYPRQRILIYSQQSTWPGPNFQGARAAIFYAKCTVTQ
jgi:hypothetical protein